MGTMETDSASPEYFTPVGEKWYAIVEAGSCRKKLRERGGQVPTKDVPWKI